MPFDTPLKKYIIIAEDDEFYAGIFKEKLSHAGFEVLIAENGQVALDAIRHKKPDMLILDLIMPVKDGFETLKELRSDPQIKDVKVIVVSTLSQEETIARCKNFGIISYLPKSKIPFPEAVETVKKYLS